MKFETLNPLYRLTVCGWIFMSCAFGSSGAGELTEVWTQRYNGPGNGRDTPYAVAVDEAGNVFVTGESFGNGTTFDIATIAYSSSGVPLWTNRYNGDNSRVDQGRFIAVDKNGNIIVTGYSFNTNYRDILTVGYSNGGLPLWTNRYNGGAIDAVPVGLGIDQSGDVFVAGVSMVIIDYDYLGFAFSNAGNFLWGHRYNVGQVDFPTAMVVDSRRDRMYITGYTTIPGGSDFLTLAYSSTGTVLWTNLYNVSGDLATPCFFGEVVAQWRV